MTIKILKIISITSIFILSILTHSLYDKFPNILTSFFYPVNESIFEHMKMLNMSYLIWSIIEFILLKKNNLETKNFKASIVISLIFNIFIFLIIYIPIYKLFGYNAVITILLYLLSIIISQFISFKVLSSTKDYYFLNKYFFVIIFIILLTFIYLTYYPPKVDIFIDKLNKKIGLSNYY